MFGIELTLSDLDLFEISLSRHDINYGTLFPDIISSFFAPSFLLYFDDIDAGGNVNATSKFSFKSNNQNMLSVEIQEGDEEKGLNLDKMIKPKFKLNHLMTISQYSSDHQFLKDHRSLIAINFEFEKNLIKKLTFYVSFTVTKNNAINMFTNSIEFNELFNCPKMLTDAFKPDEITGIFFQTDTFYIFLGRSFVELKGVDLFNTSFRIEEDSFQLQQLKFENKRDLVRVFYDVKASKYIRTIDTYGFFVCFKEVFQLTVSQSDPTLKLVKTNQYEAIKNCNYQTIKFKQYLFCFTPDYYYMIYDFKLGSKLNKFIYNSISDMFVGSNVNFDQDKKGIQIIFTYLANRFVMMTINYYYIIYYEIVEVHLENGFKITLNPTSTFPILKQPHFLFDQISLNVKVNRNQTKGFRFSTLNSILIAAILMLMFIILCMLILRLASCVRKSDAEGKKKSQKFEERENLSEIDIERNKKYRKLFKEFFNSISRSLSFFNIRKTSKQGLKEGLSSSESSDKRKIKTVSKSSSDSSKRRGKKKIDKTVKLSAEVVSKPGSYKSFDETKLHGGTRSLGSGSISKLFYQSKFMPRQNEKSIAKHLSKSKSTDEDMKELKIII